MDILDELRQRRAARYTEARKIQALADDAGRDLNEIEERQFTEIMTECDQISARIEREVRLRAGEEGAERSHREPTRPVPDGTTQTATGGVKFRSLGEQLRAVAGASRQGGYIDPRLTTRAGVGMSEGMPSDGGFAVQTDFASGIWARVYETGRVLADCDRLPISANSNSMKLPAIDETSRANGSRWGGIQAYWGAEGGTLTASRPKLRMNEYNLEKLHAVVYMTDELLADSAALEAYVLANVPNEIVFKVEDAIFRGSGAGQPHGILNSSALVTQTKVGSQTATTFVTGNAAAMLGRLPTSSILRAKWYMNQDVWQQVLQLTLSNEPMFIAPGRIADAPFGMLLGRPIVPTEYNATMGTVGDVLLADLSQYQIIEKGGIQFASSIHVQFLTDETAFRFTYRVDGGPKWNSALTPYQGSNTISPFVVVETRS